MPKIIFKPKGEICDVISDAKILAVAIKNKVNIRYGCGACRCGTCAVKISGDGVLNKIDEAEKILLTRLKLSLAGDVRLSCKSRIQSGEIFVDLDFQKTYSPEEDFESKT